MGYDLIIAGVLIDAELALGKITEQEALARWIALSERTHRRLMWMQVAMLIVPAVIVGGLALLALRLGTFS